MINSVTYFIQRLTPLVLLTMWYVHYLQYNTITYDANNKNAYMITHVDHNA